MLLGVRRHLSEFVDDGQCLGGQLFVWHDGELLANEAVGQCAPGHAATTDTVGQLQCAVKPLVACCVARAAERQEISFDDPVARWLPAFRGGRRDGVTLRMLLAHTSGLPNIPRPATYALDPAAYVDMICRRPLDASSWFDDSIYSQVWAWHLLGAVLERVHGTDINTILTTEVSTRIQRPSLCLAGSPPCFSPYWRRRGPDDYTAIVPVPTEIFLSRPNPAFGGLGSMTDLGYFYVDLLRGCTGEGRLLSTRSMRALTTRHSMVRFNTGDVARPYGLGFFLGGSAGDLAGRWSPDCFGHVGSIWRYYNVVAFADPATHTAAAVRLFSLSPRNNRWFRRLGRVLSADLRLERSPDPDVGSRS